MPRRSRSRSPKHSKSPRKSRRSRRTSKRRLSSGAKKWQTHMMKTFRAGRARSASYTLKKAMKDAKKTYHK
jgi:hypothetical protein